MRVLRERLEVETRHRESLEQELALRPPAPLPPESSPPPVAAASGETAPSEPTSGERAAPEQPRDGRVDAPALTRAGFTPAEIRALRERFDDIELRRLFLRDQAVREGWFRKPRFHQQMRKLAEEYDAMRDEYGDERYDWILYASGRENRVVVERVMGGSAAEDVGLQAGDVFLAYDDQAVFGARELRFATSAGELGETVAVDVERDGERIRVYPPRGPLGVGLRFERREPDPLY